MKIAIVHNYLDNIGGAEKASLTLARELGADVISTVADAKKIEALGFDVPVETVGWIPANPPWRQQLASLRMRFAKLEKAYDLFVIAGDWAISAAVRNKPNLWYCHTPSRELWDLRDYTRRRIVPWWKRPAFDVWVQANRSLNRKHLKHVQSIVCSSKNAQRRVKHYFKRDAPVVYPPVDVDQYKYRAAEGYWLSVNRLVSYKRIELQLEAFRQLPDERLIIVGSYEQARHFKNHAAHLKRIAPANVEFRHWVSDAELKDLYSRCIGFITTSAGEDFGLTAVEAMAAGKPVIAPHEGGYVETVVDGRTGRLISADEPSLIKAVKEVGDGSAGYQKACQGHVRQFATTRSLELLQKHISEVMR